VTTYTLLRSSPVPLQVGTLVRAKCKHSTGEQQKGSGVSHLFHCPLTKRTNYCRRYVWYK